MSSDYFKSRPIPDKLIRDLELAPLIDENDPIFSVGGTNAAVLVRRREELKLTKAEKEIIWLHSHGFSHKIIANMLHKSRSTVERQLQTARIVLRANNSEHAIGLALRAGLID